MEKNFTLSGVYAAAVTPLNADYSPDLDSIPPFLSFLAHRGCHGALLLGTTGEGPSFSEDERNIILQAALQVREVSPTFRLLVGTGTPSLSETIRLTRSAFDLGIDGVVVLPPYYFRKVTDDGLFAWYEQVLSKAVPEGGALLGYHIPPVTGIPLSLDLLKRLKDAFPTRFAGLKDSSGDPGFAQQLGECFGNELIVLTGNDRLFSLALHSHAAGCITAMANIFSPSLRKVWNAYQSGEDASNTQQKLNQARNVMERYPPAPPFLKGLLARAHGFPAWSVRPPLIHCSEDVIYAAFLELEDEFFE